MDNLKNNKVYRVLPCVVGMHMLSKAQHYFNIHINIYTLIIILMPWLKYSKITFAMITFSILNYQLDGLKKLIYHNYLPQEIPIIKYSTYSWLVV